MEDERERLRVVVRAIVAERDARASLMGLVGERLSHGQPPAAVRSRHAARTAAHRECERALDAALARLAEVPPEPVARVDGELDRLRNVVRALAEERQSWSAWSALVGAPEPPTEDSIARVRRAGRLHTDSKKALAAHLARLAEVEPGLVAQQDG